MYYYTSSKKADALLKKKKFICYKPSCDSIQPMYLENTFTLFKNIRLPLYNANSYYYYMKSNQARVPIGTYPELRCSCIS